MGSHMRRQGGNARQQWDGRAGRHGECWPELRVLAAGMPVHAMRGAKREDCSSKAHDIAMVIVNAAHFPADPQPMGMKTPRLVGERLCVEPAIKVLIFWDRSGTRVEAGRQAMIIVACRTALTQTVHCIQSPQFIAWRASEERYGDPSPLGA